MAEVTRWLNAPSNLGEAPVFAALYAELQLLARGRMANERDGHTLSSTALVHEAWLRLQNSAPDQWRDRQQFYGAAAEAMRRILVDSARRRLASKRGDGVATVPLDGLELPSPLSDDRLLDVHDALSQLEVQDELLARIVKLHIFSGLSHNEIAGLLSLHEKAVRRHWAVAKLMLYRTLKKDS